MKVVVLGATGFVGKRLVTALHKQAIKPHVLIRSKSSSIAGCVNVIGDALTGSGLSRLCKGADVVINLIGRFEPPFDAQVGLNVVALKKICTALDTKAIKQFIHISAAAVYGSGVSKPKESSKLLPDTDYGLSKKLGEDVVLDYHRRFRIPYIIVRPTNIYGPGATSGVVRSMMVSAQKHKRIMINGNGNHVRDFLHVDDLVDVICMLIKKGVTHRVYNVSSGEVLTLKDLAILLAADRTNTTRIQYNKKIIDPMIRIVADSSLVKRDISWKPQRTLHSATREMISVS